MTPRLTTVSTPTGLRAALIFPTPDTDVTLTGAQLDAAISLMDAQSMTKALADARQLVAWGDQTPCHYCAVPPVMARDQEGQPLCVDCDAAHAAGWSAS